MTSSDQRALASWLAGIDDEALVAVLAGREVAPTAPARDFFDLAEALLDPASIDRALSRLTRRQLDDLGGSVAHPDLVGLALTASDGRAYDAVAARLAASSVEGADRHDADSPRRADAATESVLAERAFTATSAWSELVTAALAQPIGRTGAGTVTAGDRRRLSDAGVGEAEEIDDALALASAGGLLIEHEREWTAGPSASSWLDQETLTRWRGAVVAFRESLPAGLRRADGGFVPPHEWHDAYPLDPEWRDRVAALHRTARRWGLFADDGTEPTWTAPLRAGGEPAVADLAAHLPGEIDRVFLQADLTAIAPGPLRAPLELRLRRVATRESHAQASTYRFSDESVTRAIAGGETAESLREFLGALSLTGIPQPLDYLIARTATRHGLVRVRDDDGRARVSSDDAHLLETIRIDQALRALGLLSDGADLVSRASADAVAWALLDARYPVVSVGDDGRTSHPRRTAAPAAAPPPTREARYAPLVETLRSASGDDAEAAWLTRELDQAVKTRSVVIVDVLLPDGSERSFTLEATGLAGGRLRGRDRNADVERTLPVSSVVRVRAAA